MKLFWKYARQHIVFKEIGKKCISNGHKKTKFYTKIAIFFVNFGLTQTIDQNFRKNFQIQKYSRQKLLLLTFFFVRYWIFVTRSQESKLKGAATLLPYSSNNYDFVFFQNEQFFKKKVSLYLKHDNSTWLRLQT